MVDEVPSAKALPAIALIGFGEVGRIFARDLRAAGCSGIAAWDIAFADRTSQQLAAARESGARVCASAADAVAGADVVVSAVTAGSAVAAAEPAAAALDRGAFYVDVNSVSPATKQAVASLVEAGGGRFVEAAIMTSVPPRGLKSPMLLGGAHMAAFAATMAPFAMDLNPYAERIGAASAVKMCRSVMVKGMEALFLESMVAARHYGVEDDVLASLKDMVDQDWERLGGYMMSRAITHGRRRAEEMREAARTVAEAGLEPLQSAATAVRQDWAADRNGGSMNTTELSEILDFLAARERH
jgi:3-hydroxyisobutyrate dehydrogenase-like beta-hydroxyacid dehydrogenase